LKIQYLRRKSGMTQAALASLSQTTQQQIAQIELGHTDPRLSTLVRIAFALDVNLKDLFFDKNEFIDALHTILNTQKGIRKFESLADLNLFCARKFGISPFDSTWSKIAFNNKKQTILLKE
jgi:transcriptional regulator with XRE-family HTH domain